MKKLLLGAVACVALLNCAVTSRAAIVDVSVQFDNLSPNNGISYAPIHIGFGNGIFDGFNSGSAAPAPIVTLAELGSGADWLPAFVAAEPNAVTGSLGGGPILPGASVSQTFRVDTDVTPFFTFAGMVLPSNDLFIGNDNPQAFRVFDNAGGLAINQIDQTGAQIWDAGSEQAIANNAAFIAGANAGNRVAENGVVSFELTELQTYNGLQTGAGYTFDSGLISGATPIGRFSFSVTAVPEPTSAALLGVALVGFGFRRRRAKIHRRR